MGKKQKTGRKRLAPSEKVILVGFYTRQNVVDLMGGLPIVRQKCKEWVENYPKEVETASQKLKLAANLSSA